eukprot:jgi/Mesvir1/23870/Mv25232-RA.1
MLLPCGNCFHHGDVGRPSHYPIVFFLHGCTLNLCRETLNLKWETLNPCREQINFFSAIQSNGGVTLSPLPGGP